MRAIEKLPWDRIAADLDARGYACTGAILTGAECRRLSRLYGSDERFRSRVIMSRHGFGRGEYKYFAHPLPDLVSALRVTAYPHLVPVANGWAERLGQG